MIDLHDDRSICAGSGLSEAQFTWSPQSSDGIDDTWSAARYCIDLLRGSASLRRHFPRALSSGADGAFAQWLLGGLDSTMAPATAPGLTTTARLRSGRAHRAWQRLAASRPLAALGHLAADPPRPAGLSARARRHVAQAFRAIGTTHLADIVFTRPDLGRAFPLGFTPAGLAALFVWFVTHGRVEENVRLEEIWWHFLCCIEHPDPAIEQTYLFSPDWQRVFPDGLTVFGADMFCEWLNQRGDTPAGDSLRPSWTGMMTPAQQIRLAYRGRESWQHLHPAAFASEAGAHALLRWLRGGRAGLPVEARRWCARLPPSSTVRALLRPGATVFGHFCYSSGLRTSAEAMVAALRRCDIEVAVRDVRTDRGQEPGHGRFDGLELHATTIMHVQPEPLFDTAFDRAGLYERHPRPHQVGFWYWEVDRIPASWPAKADRLDEVWAATSFVADALRPQLRRPVLTMLPGLELPTPKPRGRDHFGLPDGEFMFLFVFHMTSVMERKNPLGLIEAFRLAFAPDQAVRLVLKTSHGQHYPELMARLHHAAAGLRVSIVDAVLGGDDLLSLMQATDAYVSLHRSEGLGLTLAEAMLLGKPVIATGYSGNVDFMDARNSLLVDYDLVELQRTVHPYEAGSHWAEPSVGHAAQLMRRVFENPAWAAELGARGRADASATLSLEAAGRRMARRLAEIAAGIPAQAVPFTA